MTQGLNLTGFNIADIAVSNPVIAAPMAGVSDKPYRQVCRNNGAGLVVSEMVTSQPQLRDSRKTSWRLDHKDEAKPRVVQIVGNDPLLMADAARFNQDRGAQIVDINMGCPAKKVCNKAAGSALLADTKQVKTILNAVVNAVDIPVTLKYRTGPTPDESNAVQVAQIAESEGIAALTLHARSRACKFVGPVNYQEIANVKESVNIPVIANGDIDSPEKAIAVIQKTNADGVMVGRSALGRPWLLGEISQALTGRFFSSPDRENRYHQILAHIESIHAFYGDVMGIRLARKHIKWYLQSWTEGPGWGTSNLDYSNSSYKNSDSSTLKTALSYDSLLKTEEREQQLRLLRAVLLEPRSQLVA
jgi:tRNA-dihydrouridine synthase B